LRLEDMDLVTLTLVSSYGDTVANAEPSSGSSNNFQYTYEGEYTDL
jgi:hypothetical protein